MLDIIEYVSELKNEAVKKCSYETGANFREIEVKLKTMLWTKDLPGTESSIPESGWKNTTRETGVYTSGEIKPSDIDIPMNRSETLEYLTITCDNIQRDIMAWFFSDEKVQEYIVSIVKKAL